MRTGHSSERVDFPLPQSLQQTLRKITERLAFELAEPTAVAPDWTPIEWRLARAVAAIHCASPALADCLRWQGPAEWRDFLTGQKAHVAARHRRIHALLNQIDTCAREAAVAIVGLKGTALHSMGFYRAGERPMADVDLLVREGDTTRAGQVLESLGFSESFANWKHGVFVPAVRDVHSGFGEHADNYIKIELHTRIAEKLPLRITDVTDSIYPCTPHPGLNAYPSKAALLAHLLIHAAGGMAYSAMRIMHLHDIALVSARMDGSDWDELMKQSLPANKRWWALPPLQLTARYYPRAIPTDVLATVSKDCPWTLRHLVRHHRISDVSLSYPWVQAFPGIGWSQSWAEIVEYIGGRIWPDDESRRVQEYRVATDFASANTQWGRLSHGRRMLRWMTSRPLRVDTLNAVRMALQAHPATCEARVT